MWLPLIVAVAMGVQAPVAAAQAPRAAVTRVRGTFVKADGGGPLPRAAVRLTGQGETREATSDTVGRFEFTDVPTGEYVLSVTRGGHIDTVTDVTVAAAIDDLVVRMARGGAIAGRIVDDTGEPVVDVRVQALRAEYVTGGKRLAARRGATTNDLGEYRIYGLPPGIYYVAATTTRFDLEGYDPDKRVNISRGGPGFAPTFFPGSPVAADAQPVPVRAGADVPGIDFALRSVRLARLSGVVVDSRGRPAPDTLVLLNMARAGGIAVTPTIGDMGFVEPAADGSFVLSQVKPGDYRLDVYAKAAIEAIARTGSVGRAQSGSMPEYASVPVSVSGEDMDNIRIATTPGRRLAGRISADGAPPPPEVLSRVKLSTVDRRAGLSISATMSVAPAVIQPDGTFEVLGVGGVRVVSVSGLPAGWALEGVRAGGVDITDAGVEIRDADVTDLEVMLTAKAASIGGSVVDASDRPLAGVPLIVFPDDRERWASPPNRHLASLRTAPDGTFEVSPLPPGDYLVAVVDDLVDGEWGEAEHLERLRASATRVTLAGGERRTLALRR